MRTLVFSSKTTGKQSIEEHIEEFAYCLGIGDYFVFPCLLHFSVRVVVEETHEARESIIRAVSHNLHVTETINILITKANYMNVLTSNVDHSFQSLPEQLLKVLEAPSDCGKMGVFLVLALHDFKVAC